MELFKQLNTLNEEVEIEDKDIILDSIESLTRFTNADGKEIPDFCRFKTIQDNFGLSDKDLLDLAKENGYNVFKIKTEDNSEFVIAHPDCSEEVIKEAVFDDETPIEVEKVEFKEVKEMIEKQPNVEYKGFTIEHSPMGLVVDFTPDNLNKEHEMEIEGWFIHSPYYLQSNPNKERIYLPLFCEDEYGNVISFETLDQAKKYIDDWMASKKGKIKLKGWKKDECHFEILPEFRKEKKVDEKLNGWSNEFVNEEDVEEGDEYKITKCDVVTHYYLDHGKKPDKVEHDKYRVYFRRYKQLSNGGNYLDKNNWYEYGEGGYWFDSYEKARQAVEKYGKKLKESENPYDEPSKNLAKRVKKACKLSKEDYNTLLHDLNNLRGDEWLEQVESCGDEKLIADFKAFVSPELEEDIEKHEELNPLLFEGNKLKPEIREALQKVADAFVEDLKEDDINIKVNDVILVGSNCSYNYTKDSDLDIHIIADSSALECPKELVDKLYSAYRSIFNKNYDITIKGIPAEIYVELDSLGAAKSNGIYSIMKDEWIKEPVQQDIPELDREAFDALFTQWEDRYFDIVGNKEIEDPDFVDTSSDMNESKTMYGDDTQWDYYEVYCERGTEAEYSNDNFSLCIKVPHGTLEPNEEDVEEFFKENYPEIIGEYHVVGVWDTINDFAEDEINLNDFDHIYTYSAPVLASAEDEINESLFDEIDKFITDVYELRKTSINKEGEYGLGNLVFKELRNLGYLDNLKELKKQERAKQLSLEGLKENLDLSQYSTKEALAELRKQVEEDGTYSEHEGKLTKEDLDSGYMVSFFRPEITNEEIKQCLEAIGGKLGKPYFGLWIEGPEISYLFAELPAAKKFAKIFNQKEIWDNAKKEPIANEEFEDKKLDYSKAIEEFTELYK